MAKPDDMIVDSNRVANLAQAILVICGGYSNIEVAVAFGFVMQRGVEIVETLNTRYTGEANG